MRDWRYRAVVRLIGSMFLAAGIGWLLGRWRTTSRNVQGRQHGPVIPRNRLRRANLEMAPIPVLFDP